MTTFHENKTLTTEGNFEWLIGIAKVGDRYISGTSTYERVDIRKNKGVAWLLIESNTSKEYKCYECKHQVVNFDNILDGVNEENILCESCDEFISYHPGCTIVPRSE